ncbi:cytochrome P450 4Z1-like isoform X1 [Mytilus californianus]|uniref:cytochrome P450 4Z1-like isoform X1 n=1 Tax=Mytilus californianus TaxID=6549 RepID=UPI0022473D71|nr:cytochrome P450 4Z1-like isoform X1 [Mytilus californianus]
MANFHQILSFCCIFCLKLISYIINVMPWFSDGSIPNPSLIIQYLLQKTFGDEKLKKLELLTQFYHKQGLFRFDDKIYIFNQKLAQTAINKLEKGAEKYLDNSPLKDTFLGSSQKSPETRRAIASLFRKTSIEERASLMTEDIKKMCLKIKQQSLRSVNITHWSLRLALDIVGHVLLQLDLNALDGEQDELLECMVTILHKCYALNEISTESDEFKRANEDLDRITSNILKDALEKDDTTIQKRLVVQLHEACGFEEAKDNMKLFLMAGTETTASSIPVVFSLLTDYPHIQEELRDEAIDRWSEMIADPTTSLPKIESMIKEILRLYPIAPFISRQNNVPVNLGNIHLDQHSDVVIFTWGIHRSPYLWHDSKVFKPFRFLGEEALQSNMYIPFGAGSRVCIGQHLAVLELRLAIAILLHTFTFSKNLSTPDLKFVVDWAHAVVHPDKDMMFTLQNV